MIENLDEYFENRMNQLCKKETSNFNNVKEYTRYSELTYFDTFSSNYRKKIQSSKTININANRLKYYFLVSISLFIIILLINIFVYYHSILVLIDIFLFVMSIDGGNRYYNRLIDNTIILIDYKGINYNNEQFNWNDIYKIYNIVTSSSINGEPISSEESIMLCFKDKTMRELDITNFKFKRIKDYIKFYRRTYKDI